MEPAKTGSVLPGPAFGGTRIRGHTGTGVKTTKSNICSGLFPREVKRCGTAGRVFSEAAVAVVPCCARRVIRTLRRAPGHRFNQATVCGCTDAGAKQSPPCFQRAAAVAAQKHSDGVGGAKYCISMISVPRERWREQCPCRQQRQALFEAPFFVCGGRGLGDAGENISFPPPPPQTFTGGSGLEKIAGRP